MMFNENMEKRLIQELENFQIIHNLKNFYVINLEEIWLEITINDKSKSFSEKFRMWTFDFDQTGIFRQPEVS
jgi:hypothetical protein